MKHTITALLLLSVIFSEGQTTEKTLGKFEPIDSATVAKYGFPVYSDVFPGEGLPERDTIKVVFLVGHGDRYRKGMIECIGDSCHTIYDTTLLPNIWQMPGYIIRRKQRGNHGEAYWMVTVARLDEKKKPLSASLIIWQVQEEPNS